MRKSARLLSLAVIVACTTVACSSGSTTSQSPGGNGDDAFNAAVAAYTEQPTSLVGAPALTVPPPRGKKVVQLTTGAGNDQIGTEGLRAACAELGWDFSTLQHNLADPSTTVSALTTAIDSGADVVTLAVTPIAVWKSVLPAARAQGTIIIVLSGAEDLAQDPAPEGVIYVNNGVTAAKLVGPILADAALADAGPDPKDIQMVATEIPQLGAQEVVRTAAVRERLSAECPTCSLDSVQIPFADVAAGNGPRDVVAYLQTHPDTKYVIVGAGLSVSGLSQAIRAASLPPVRILGSYPGPDQLEALKTGDNLAWAVFPNMLQSWEVIDAAVRSLTNQAPYEWEPSWWLITRQNIDQVSNLAAPEFSLDLPSQFLPLWKVEG